MKKFRYRKGIKKKLGYNQNVTLKLGNLTKYQSQKDLKVLNIKINSWKVNHIMEWGIKFVCFKSSSSKKL